MQSLGLLLPILLLGVSTLLNAAVLVYFGVRTLRAVHVRRVLRRPRPLLPPAAAPVQR